MFSQRDMESLYSHFDSVDMVDTRSSYSRVTSLASGSSFFSHWFIVFRRGITTEESCKFTPARRTS